MKKVFALSLYFSYFTFLLVNNFIRFIISVSQNENFLIVIWGFDCRLTIENITYNNKIFVALILFILIKLILLISAYYIQHIYKTNFYLNNIFKLIISSYIFDVLSVISRLTNVSLIEKLFYSNFPLFKFNSIFDINQLVIPISFSIIILLIHFAFSLKSKIFYIFDMVNVFLGFILSITLLQIVTILILR